MMGRGWVGKLNAFLTNIALELNIILKVPKAISYKTQLLVSHFLYYKQERKCDTN